jgi:thymidine kinase
MAPSTTSPRDVASEHIGGLEKYEARCRLHFQPA